MTTTAEAVDAIELPVLRWGEPYRSMDRQALHDLAGARTLAHLHLANAGLLRRDLLRAAAARRALAGLSTDARLACCRRAADLFTEADLPLPGGPAQSPAAFQRSLSASTGLPLALVRANMAKLHDALSRAAEVITGLTRGLPTTLIDTGRGVLPSGQPVAFAPTTDCLGVVLPSNSPGVNSLWLPALALGIPVALKPGRNDPWTPLRLIQALIAAGLPAAAFGFYPSDHEGADALVRGAGRALVFGDQTVAAHYADNPRVEVHGPGHSKVVLGPDEAPHWEQYLDVIVESICANGGRSCVNASAVLTPSHADALAEALARRLAAIVPRAADDPEARLAAITTPRLAEMLDQALDSGLRTPGAREVTAAHRAGPRRVEAHGAQYLLPTVVRCDSREHPLAEREFLFPYCSVIQVPPSELIAAAHGSLALTLITHDPDLVTAALQADIQRLNVGPIPTSRVQWDQPHEGNLFDFLYQRRAFASAEKW